VDTKRWRQTTSGENLTLDTRLRGRLSTSLMGQGRWLVSERRRRLLGCLRSLRAPAALDGVSWAQSGSVEIAVGQTDRMLQNRRHHLLPPTGVAPLGSSVRPPILLSAARLGRLELGAVP